MNRKWTIECVADFSADEEKNGTIDELVRNSAVTLQAALLLLSGAQKPQVVCYADDFFMGRTEIDMLAAPVQAPVDATSQPASDEPPVSDEMLAALRGLKGQ